MSKNIVKATKSKKIAYRNEKAANDKNLLLANREILVMRVQNEPKLRFFAIFSQLSSEHSLQELSPDETFIIKDIQFLPDAEQTQIKSSDKSAQNNHRNILAIIDNRNRVYLMEIKVEYEKGNIQCTIFAEMPSQEQEECQQIFWSGEHMMVLKEGSLIIDRKLKLKNHSIMQKQQYLVGTKEIVCKRIVSGKNQQNRMLFYGISGNSNSVFLNDKDNQSLFFAISLTTNSDLLDIYLSAYNDLIVATRQGVLFALGTEKLDKIQQYNVKLEDDEFVVEAHMDNTLTSIFLLTNKNQIYHIYIQKAKLKDGSVQVFKSKGNLRFHSKNIIFTFCVLAMPESNEQCIFRQNENNTQIQSSFVNFKPNPSNVKYLLYSLLISEEVMKIFSVDLSLHEPIFQDSDIEFEYPVAFIDSSENLQYQQPQLQQLNQNSNPQILSSNNITPSNKVSVTSIPNDSLPNFDQFTTQKVDNGQVTIPTQQPKQVKIVEAPSQIQSNDQLSYYQHIPEKSVQKSQFGQEATEHKQSSKPVNPSILPTPQDPIVQQYYQFDQMQQQAQQQQQVLHFLQQKEHQPHVSHEQKEVKKKNQIRTLTNQQNENYLAGEEDQYQDQHSHHSHHQQHQEHKSQFDDVKDYKIHQVFSDNVERITTTLDEYFEKKFNKLDANIGSKIEKIRKDDDIVNMVDRSTQSMREKLEHFLHDQMESQYKNYVEQNMKTYMIDMFQQVTKNFERGQKFYTDKIQQEKEKCKIQNENSDEILGIVKKITGPFSESTIIHKKILTDIVQHSNERRSKMDSLEKQLSQLISKQDLIVNKIQSMEKTLQEEMAPAKIQKMVEQSVASQIQKLQQFPSSGVQFRSDNVVIQYPNKKQPHQQVDFNSANESGGDNSRKNKSQQQQAQQYKRKV